MKHQPPLLIITTGLTVVALAQYLILTGGHSIVGLVLSLVGGVLIGHGAGAHTTARRAQRDQQERERRAQQLAARLEANKDQYQAWEDQWWAHHNKSTGGHQ